MRKILSYSLFLSFLLVLISSCKKDGEQYNLQDGNFQSNSLTSSVTDVVLSQANENNTVLKLNWLSADFGKMPAIGYTLQIDTPADTTSSHWANATSIVVGNNVLEYSFIGKTLNDLLNTRGIATGVANKIVFRIKSDVNQNNGAASTMASVYSNVVTVNITSYALDLRVPGDYQGWDPSSAPILKPWPGKPGLYEGYVYMEAPGLHYFKYTNAPDWNHTNYGDGGGGSFSTDGAAGGLSVPDGGYYELTANLNNNTWTATKTTWGIIGDATPNGWSGDTPMTYDPVAQVWTVTANMIKNGSFKFRANGEWAIDFGIDNNGKLVYADNPFFGYTPNLNNLSVPEDGNYTITLDLHVSANYTYILHKN